MTNSAENSAALDRQWEGSIWFSDVDDCLINTGEASRLGSLNILSVFNKEFGLEKASAVQKHFNNFFELLLNANQGTLLTDPNATGLTSYREMTERGDAMQYFIGQDFGHFKRWSREVLIVLAAQQAGISDVKITPEIISTAANAYWHSLLDSTVIFEDAIKLSNSIDEHGRPLILATASDARLELRKDLKYGLQFKYDPEESLDFKKARLNRLKLGTQGLKFAGVKIGDPIDKPNPLFFEDMVELGLRSLGEHAPKNFDLSRAVMLGDSKVNDLDPPDNMGFGLLVLRVAGLPEVQVTDKRHVAVGELSDALQFFK